MAMSLELESPPARIELRLGRRVVFQRRAWCEHRDLTLYLMIADLSPRGMFIQTSTPFEVGERLRVCVHECPRIVVDVEIVRSVRRARQAGIGCRVLAFAQGADSYAGLLAQLSEAADDLLRAHG